MKKQSVKTLKNKLDTIFSTYIRKRDTDWRGYGRCCSCNKNIPYEEGDAGHFIGRGKQATRYDERNAHIQCHYCNRFQHGNIIGYYEFMLKKYGKEIIDELKLLSSTKKHWTIKELKDLISLYDEKTKTISKSS